MIAAVVRRSIPIVRAGAAAARPTAAVHAAKPCIASCAPLIASSFSASPDYADRYDYNAPNVDFANVISGDQSSRLHPAEEGPRTSVLMELTDRVGALHDVLRFL